MLTLRILQLLLMIFGFPSFSPTSAICNVIDDCNRTSSKHLPNQILFFSRLSYLRQKNYLKSVKNKFILSLWTRNEYFTHIASPVQRCNVIYVSCWDTCVWQISQSQLILYSELSHCKIMTKFLERAQNTSGEPDKPYMPDVSSPRYPSGSIKTAAAKHLWKSDPRLFELGVQKLRDPKSMTVFSNLPEVMEQNPGRARTVSQSPAAWTAAVGTITSSLLRKAMLNVSSFSTKSSVRALCTHRQRDLTSLIPAFDSY